MPKYRIQEDYILETPCKDKDTIKEQIITNQVDFRDISEYNCKITDSEDRYFYHCFTIHSGESEFDKHNVYTLYDLREIARAQQCEGTDEEITQDSHMIIGYHGFEEVDAVDEDCYWDNEMVSHAYISHVQEITKEEYEVLRRRL
tara:strand:- start:351 stop:785 length:435 start_codon:yes stop_codon:yes gene_type:complete